MATAEQLGLSIGDYALTAVASTQDYHSGQYMLKRPLDLGADGADTIFEVLRVQAYKKNAMLAEVLASTHPNKGERIGSQLMVVHEFPNFVDTIPPRMNKVEDRMAQQFAGIGVTDITQHIEERRQRVIILQKGKTHGLLFR